MRSIASKVACFCTSGTFSTRISANWSGFVFMTNFWPSHVKTRVSRLTSPSS
jgi:hypothetical protein